MATFERRGDKIRVSVCVNRIRRSKTFTSKSAARVWAAEQESDISGYEIPDKTVSDLLDRYVNQVSKDKKGHRWESIRIEAIKRTRIARVRLKDLSATHASEWRDERLQSVSSSTVLREKTILSHAFQLAVDEWGWLKKNPFHKLRMPKENPPRSRIASDQEIELLVNSVATEIQKEVVRMALFSLETGMRAGEIAGLKKVIGNIAFLPDTKNGEPREVPLSLKALEIWDNRTFSLTPRQLDANWRKFVKSCGIQDLHFHDLRATAATRLSKKLTPFQLAKMFGWKDINQAMTYYRETADDLAKLL